MYIPEHFRESRLDVLHDTMREIGAATLVTSGSSGLCATHVPIELRRDPAPLGTICCHFARGNPHASEIENASEVLLVFQGPQCYVTPSWYPSKDTTHKVVPTLNYVAIHAYGRATLMADQQGLVAHLGSLTALFERDFEEPWAIDDAPAGFIEKMARGIVGIEIPLARIEGKNKLSQNRSADDRAGVVRGLRAAGSESERAIADLVEATGPNERGA